MYNIKKYLITEKYLTITDLNNQPAVVLIDYNHYGPLQQAITEWCAKHGAVFTGLMISFPDTKTRILWCLRWG